MTDDRIALTLSRTEQHGTLTYRLENGETRTRDGWFRLCSAGRYVQFRSIRNRGHFNLAYTHEVIAFYTNKEGK